MWVNREFGRGKRSQDWSTDSSILGPNVIPTSMHVIIDSKS